MTSVTELTRVGFAAGYAEDGTLPFTGRTRAVATAIQEAAIGASDFGSVAGLILEAGRTEGKRAKREKRHSRLYQLHAAELAKAIGAILGRLAVADLAAQLVQLAAAQATAGQTPVLRRRAVAGAALTAIMAQVHSDDRLTLDGINSDGWRHATAYGTGEAESTPPGGGPPLPAKVAAAASVALALTTRSEADSASAAFLDQQLQAVAMGAALAAGDGTDLGEATRKLTASLVDTGAATRTYTDQLHSAVMQAYVNRTSQDRPGALYRWVTAANPCDECIDDELDSPYPVDQLPECPAHMYCQCNIELDVSTPAELVNA